MLPQTKVFVGSLPQGSKPEDLRKLFERFGVVTECDIMNRCGFVHMQTEEQAGAAIRALNNSSFNGGVISVERGRIKERGQRGGGGGGRGMRGGMRGGRGGGPMRSGPVRDSPYARERPAPPPYERAPPAYDDRYNGYGGEDRRGFALRDPYAHAHAPQYAHDDRGPRYDEPPMYADRRYDDRELDRRPPYDRAPPRHAPPPAPDMFSRRSPMRGGGGPPVGPGGYDRDPYAQQYPPMGRHWPNG